MDTLSNLYGWLTGNWNRQNTFGKTFLGCFLLLMMCCICGLPLVLLNFIEI